MVHRKSEAGLETVKFFESLLRTSADGIVVTGMMQNIIFANEAFCDLFGLSKREIMETSLLTLLEQAGVDAAKRWAEAEQLVHSRGSSRDMEIRLTRGNKVGCYSVNASRLEKSAGDDGVFILSLWRDVSRSKEAEEALRKYREDLELRVQERTAELELERNKLKGILDSMPDGAYVVSRRNEIEYINPVIEREFGLVEGRKCHEYFHDLPSTCPWCKNADVFSGKTVRWEWSSSKTGKTYDLFDTPVPNENGTVSKLEFFHDITERKRAQDALVKSEALLRLILETLPVGVWIIDKEGIVISSNEQGRKIWSGARYVGMDQYGVYKGWWPDTGKPIKNHEWAGARAIINGETSIGEIVEIEGFDGVRKMILISAAPLRDVDHGITGAVVINEDITALWRAKEELREKITELELRNRELQDITVVAAHDLQEPLRKIQTWADLLCNKYSSVLDETGRGYLGRVQNAAGRMRSLINDALSYSRASIGPASVEEIDLNRVIGEVLGGLKDRLRLEEAEVKAENMISIPADHAQMLQLFHELLNNALKYRGKAAPKIRIQGSCEGRTYRILVEDNGIGFDGRYADKIFEPFERLHQGYEGTGIGLAICRRIVERHNGRITARSAPGKGSVFEIELPLKG